MTETVARDIAATPEAVWAVVSNITRIGEWSPECYDCHWDVAQQPGLGATFTGRNRLGDKEWSNQSTVIEWLPYKQLVWEVRLSGPAREMFGDDPFARWGFTIEGSAVGSRLTQATEDLRSDGLRAASLRFLPEVLNRRQRNLDTMAVTLDAIAQACEA